MNIKRFIRKYKYLIKDVFTQDALKVSWDRGTNFGDAINPILLEKIFNKKVLWVNREYYPNNYLMSIGSILQKSTSNALVWGTGYISADSKFKSKPKKIYAVRGPLTRDLLLKQGVECPEIYGDPALLLPQVYYPKIEKKYKLGVIPHYVDKEDPKLKLFTNHNDILIIDVKNPNHYEFIDKLLSCEKIVSSSLHGIIVADAYNVPSKWIEFSNKVKGNGFKFLDYFLSVQRKDTLPILIDESIKIEDIYNSFSEYKIIIDLELLLNANPYWNKTNG